MKVAMIVPSLKPTGPVRVAFDLTTCLREEAEVDVFYFDELPENISFSNSFPIKQLHSSTLAKYDVVHSHGLRPDYFVWKNARYIRNSVSTLHNYMREDLTYQYNAPVGMIFPKVWQLLLSRHNVLVALSEHMKQYYQKRTNVPTEVIANTRLVEGKPMDNELAERIKKFSAGNILLGNISYVTDRKGLDQIIDVLRIMPDARFVHFGHGKSLEKLKEQVVKAGVSDRCLFMGEHSSALHHLPLMDVFVLPSLSEGFPLALLEAVQMQVPVVCSDIPVHREIFSRSEVSFFPLGDIDGLKSSIESAFSRKEEMQTNALEKFNREYHPHIIAGKYLKLYRSLING